METPRITDYGDVAIDEYGNHCERHVRLSHHAPRYCERCGEKIRGDYWLIDASPPLRFHARCVKVHTAVTA